MGKMLTQHRSSSKAAVVDETRRTKATYIPATIPGEMRRRTIPQAGKRKPHTYYDWGQRPYVPHLLSPTVAALTSGDASNGV